MNYDLAPQVIAAIEGFLAKRDAADVPGLVQKHLKVTVSRADVIEVYNRIAATKLGRSKVRVSQVDPRPMPDDFTALAPVTSSEKLRAHYGVSGALISRWRNETGIKAPRPVGSGTAAAPVPKDFRMVAATMTRKQLRLHYGRGLEVINRWISESDVKPKKLRIGYINGPVDKIQRDMTHVGQAADHLRRWGPVYRCDKRGKPDAKGTMWRRGLAVLTDEELTERAEAKGFDPNAWQRVAA